MITEPNEARGSERACVYRVLRYTPNLVRDEWLNIGVLVFDPETGERRLRMIEDADEYARVRRLHPQADEAAAGTARRSGKPLRLGQRAVRGERKWGEARRDGRQGARRLAETAGEVGRDAFECTATGAAEGHLRERSGCGDRAAVRRSCGGVAADRTCRRAGKSRRDSFVLRSSAETGASGSGWKKACAPRSLRFAGIRCGWITSTGAMGRAASCRP